MDVAAGREHVGVEVGVRVEPEDAQLLARLAAVARDGADGADTQAVVAAEQDRQVALRELADRAPDRKALDRRDALMRDVLPSRYLLLDIDRDRTQRLNQMSAPVFDANGNVVHTFMILGTSYDLRPEEIDALGAQLIAAAIEATTRLGGRPRFVSAR